MPLFPWPPPKPSAFAPIRREKLVKKAGQTRLGDVADLLENAFEQAGYGEKTWYAVAAGGFALASRLEKFNADGTTMGEDERWSAKIDAPRVFGVRDVLRALFTAQEGHYRIIVFVVTPKAYRVAETGVSPEEASDWVRRGSHKLPESIRQAPYTSDYICDALIYEFEQITRNQEPAFKDPSKWQGERHLQLTKIWDALGG